MASLTHNAEGTLATMTDGENNLTKYKYDTVAGNGDLETIEHPAPLLEGVAQVVDLRRTTRSDQRLLDLRMWRARR